MSPSSGERECEHNAQCTRTAGGAKWCDGPRTDKCYWLDNNGGGGPVWRQGGNSIQFALRNSGKFFRNLQLRWFVVGSRRVYKVIRKLAIL